LRLRSPFRFSETIVQDMLASPKPPTQLIIANPATYAMSYPTIEQRIKALNATRVDKISGHHHLHMDNAQEVFETIIKFLQT